MTLATNTNEELQMAAELKVVESSTELLDRVVREVAQLSTNIISDSWRVGKLLLEAREQFPANRDFGAWREERLSPMGISAKTAERLMNVARKYPTLEDIPGALSLSMLYLVSAPTTSDRIADAVVERVEGNPEASYREVAGIVSDLRYAERRERKDAGCIAAAVRPVAKAPAEAVEDDESDPTFEKWRVRVRPLIGKSAGKRREELSAMLQALREAKLLRVVSGSVYANKDGFLIVECSE